MSGKSGKQGRAASPGVRKEEGLRPITQKAYRKIILWEDVRDIVMSQIDAVLILLIVTAVAFPIMWFTVGDVAILAGYAALLSIACVAALYLAFLLADHRLRSLSRLAQAGVGVVQSKEKKR